MIRNRLAISQPLRCILRNARRSLLSCVINITGPSRDVYERLVLFDRVMAFVSACRVPGDYLEFGCYDGGSLASCFEASRRQKTLDSMRFFVFDSFQGLPEPKGPDANGLLVYKKGDYTCDLDSFKRNLKRQGVDLSHVTCTPGWYNETLNEELKRRLSIKRAAVILIDCDLYESTVPVLDFIADYIQDGTVLIFDDWFSYKGRMDCGEARAFRQWLEKNPAIQATEYYKAGRTVMSFILHVAVNPPHGVREGGAVSVAQGVGTKTGEGQELRRN